MLVVEQHLVMFKLKLFTFFIFIIFIWLFYNVNLVLKALITVSLICLTTRGWSFCQIIYHTFGRDLRGLVALLKTRFFLYLIKTRNATVPILFKNTVNKHPNKVVFLYEDEKWTFKQLDEFSNTIANYFLDNGFNRGDEIALVMDSRPEFVGIWLGLAKAGLVAALINTNQRKDTLVHSITSVSCKGIIFGNEYTQAVKEIIPSLNGNPIKYFCFGQTNETFCRHLKDQLKQISTKDPITIKEGKYSDRLFYIYTSGTTGLPKAAIIKHNRYAFFGMGLKNILKIRSDDVIYTALPLYHQAAGTLGTAQCIIGGTTMAIRSKFSASKFWDDCIKYNCTVAQYIGEICRYLLAQPPKPTDRQHKVRLIFGNGLRPKLWREFVERFNIKQVGEFYGSTEGNANVVNNCNKEGSCGFVSRIASFIYPVTLIKVDETTGEPVRDENGLCIRAQPNETGEFVGKIIDSDPTRCFDGYASRDATKKKIIYDVFHKGDRAFSSGDLLTMDELGFLYFKDRTGDTFRWKGENVSTMEVEAVISNYLQLTDCIVFGVEIDGCEGKAGMVVIPDPDKKINLNELLRNLQKVLPTFAIPIFVRIVNNLSMTGTFKLPKNELQKQGYNPTNIQDPLYIFDAKKSQYIKFDESLYESLINGQFKV